MEKFPPGQERRQYIRLDTVFPVQCKLLNSGDSSAASEWVQGFTNNISKGGICLSLYNLAPEQVRLVTEKKVRAALEISVPLRGFVVGAEAGIGWVREFPEQRLCLIGLLYEKVEPARSAALMRYARIKQLFFPVTVAVLSVLFAALALGTYINIKLIRGNRALINHFIGMLQDSAVAKQKIKEISRDKEDLLLRIQALESGIQSRLEEKDTLEATNTKKIGELENTIDMLKREKLSLHEQLGSLQKKEDLVTEDLLRLNKSREALQQKSFNAMYHWLSVHQNPRTGLVMSFEGDDSVANWAFIYDQSLATQAFLLCADRERAYKVLDFFLRKAKKTDGFFANAYYVSDGTPAEYIVHSGPNIWVGLAAVQYTHKTQDTRFMGMAEEIAAQIIRLQHEDREGGIKGGPRLPWYSTEHNLDAYAFFSLLAEMTGKQEYAQARDKVLEWLKRHTYDKTDVPIRRGKGDSTIATDTFAWSIAAIGPRKLLEIGMNPDDIVSFAEKTCLVEVDYQRPEGRTVRVKGFDFAPQQHLPRGGVVSSEWTAQMIIAQNIMADYYHPRGLIAKARAYEKLSNEYLMNLCQMIISSPSPSGQGFGCLPYASSDAVDTGHGWITPKGKNTGSVAGTAYTLFAYYNYNPLAIKKE